MQARIGNSGILAHIDFMWWCDIVFWTDDQLFQIILWITVILVIRGKYSSFSFFFPLAKPLNVWLSVTPEKSALLPSAENSERNELSPINTVISKMATAQLSMGIVKRRALFSTLFLHWNERVWGRMWSPGGSGHGKAGFAVGFASSLRLDIHLGSFLQAANSMCGARMLTSAAGAKGSLTVLALLFSSHH